MGYLSASQSSEAQLEIEIYPNPAQSEITICSSLAESTIAEITDMFGNVVLSTELSSPKTNVDITSVAAGIYFVKVNSRIFNFIKR